MPLVEIVHPDGSLTGEIVSQEEALEKGLLKRCIWIFFVCRHRGVLFQMRSRRKSLYPSHWHVSVSGHIDVGETPLQAAQREMGEELGIEIDEKMLQYQGIFTEKKNIQNDRITNDLLYTYLVDWTDKETDFTLQKEEVDCVKWFSFEELAELFNRETWPEDFVPYRETFRSILSTFLGNTN